MNRKSKSNKVMNIPFEEIDKVIHEPARMKIMANLYFVESMDAIFLLRQTDLTWGNLATHTKKLEAAGYIEVKKEFIKRKPHTMFILTKKGRDAFEEYTKKMKHLFEGFEAKS
ncbi:MAG: transcriptional regulator [Thermoplasmatales archaeon]|nr:transcriptional regulator [Thermoplasmatales archaeon]